MLDRSRFGTTWSSISFSAAPLLAQALVDLLLVHVVELPVVVEQAQGGEGYSVWPEKTDEPGPSMMKNQIMKAVPAIASEITKIHSSAPFFCS